MEGGAGWGGEGDKEPNTAGWLAGRQARVCWHTAALCRAHGLTAAGKDSSWGRERQLQQGPSKANFIVGLRSGLFPPGPAATESWGEELLCRPQHIHHIQTQHGGLTGPPSVTAARPLLAPHFLNPGFLGLGVVLACERRGCSSVPPAPHPGTFPETIPPPPGGPAPSYQYSPFPQGSCL